MNKVTYIDTDIDYEHMDDLPLSDHFEWQFYQTEQVLPDDSVDTQDKWSDISVDFQDDWLAA